MLFVNEDLIYEGKKLLGEKSRNGTNTFSENK